jgi:hypothetical protein
MNEDPLRFGRPPTHDTRATANHNGRVGVQSEGEPRVRFDVAGEGRAPGGLVLEGQDPGQGVSEGKVVLCDARSVIVVAE